MAAFSQKTIRITTPLRLLPWQLYRLSRHSIHSSSTLGSLLWSLKASARDAVFQQMMSQKDERETIVILKNPGKPSFIKTFLHPDVKQVLCIYSYPSLLQKMESKLQKIETGSSKLSYVCANIGQSDAYKDINLQDVTVKVLLKECDIRSSFLWYLHMYGFIYADGIHAAGSLEWYCAIHPQHFQNLQNRRVCVNLLPPYYNYSQVMKLNNTDFEPRKFRPKNLRGAPRGEDVVLMKAEPNYKILQYLPTAEDRRTFSRFCFMKRNIEAGKRIAPFLHERFPGCLTALMNHGFHINSLNQDISMQDYLHIYMILSKLPGFKDSDLNAKLKEDYT